MADSGESKPVTDGGTRMNFDFLKECQLESPELEQMYGSIYGDLVQAEQYYWGEPQQCGILLRRVSEKICGIYNMYYEIGCPQGTLLEEFLCYTDNDEHNVMVSRFLSVVRKEQRDRLNKLRVLGDDCIAGEAAPSKGMTFEDRMSQNARRMMETMMETLKEMCKKLNKREDICGLCFTDEDLPGKLEAEEKREKEEIQKPEKKSLFGRFFSGR